MIVLEQRLVVQVLLFIRKIAVYLILKDGFLETVSVDALLLVVAENHTLDLALLIGGSGLGILTFLMKSELLHTVAVDLELLVTQPIVGFVARYNGIVVKNTLVRSFEVSENVVVVGWLVGASLSLLSLTS
jgi:hypothetical protein